MSDDPDVRLMLSFRGGDELAFDALFERWAGRVLRFLERMVKVVFRRMLLARGLL